MAVRERVRMAPSVFRLPVEKIRDGYYSDAYFNLTKSLLEADGHHPRVLMQVFQREESILGGVDEAIAVLKHGAGHYEGDQWISGWEQLDVRALHEGDEISPWETVMTIEGDYSEFAHLETVYLGVMARRTLIMRNVHEVVTPRAASRSCTSPPGTTTGWCRRATAGRAHRGRDRRLDRRAGLLVGRPRHRHRAARADRGLRRGHRARRAQVRRPLRARHERDRARGLRQRLRAHRAGGGGGARRRPLGRAAGHLRQARGRVAAPAPRRRRATGVAAELVELTRAELDRAGFENVHIVVSGGFTAERIREFEATGVPVDSYGVGSSLIRGANDFTADVVMNDGRPCAKVGREYRPNPRLEPVR